jgi:hypothetical protein
MGAINTNYTFTATDVITSTKMNNILDQSTIAATAVFNNTLDVASGKLLVKAGGITSNEIGSNAVTTTAITDLNVTTGKIADLAITTGKLNDLSVTTGKIVDSGVTTVKVNDLAITNAKLADGSVTTSKITDASIDAAKLDGAQAGTAPIFGARAWARFSPSGTILDSGNVQSIVLSNTGTYEVTFITPMPHEDYAVFITSHCASNRTSGAFMSELATRTANSFRFVNFASTNSPTVLISSGSLVVFG